MSQFWWNTVFAGMLLQSLAVFNKHHVTVHIQDELRMLVEHNPQLMHLDLDTEYSVANKDNTEILAFYHCSMMAHFIYIYCMHHCNKRYIRGDKSSFLIWQKEKLSMSIAFEKIIWNKLPKHYGTGLLTMSMVLGDPWWLKASIVHLLKLVF